MMEVYETVITVEESIYTQFRDVAMKNGFARGRRLLNRRAAHEEALKLFIEKYDTNNEEIGQYKSEIVSPKESEN